MLRATCLRVLARVRTCVHVRACSTCVQVLAICLFSAPTLPAISLSLLATALISRRCSRYYLAAPLDLSQHLTGLVVPRHIALIHLLLSFFASLLHFMRLY